MPVCIRAYLLGKVGKEESADRGDFYRRANETIPHQRALTLSYSFSSWGYLEMRRFDLKCSVLPLDL